MRFPGWGWKMSLDAVGGDHIVMAGLVPAIHAF